MLRNLWDRMPVTVLKQKGGRRYLVATSAVHKLHLPAICTRAAIADVWKWGTLLQCSWFLAAYSWSKKAEHIGLEGRRLSSNCQFWNKCWAGECLCWMAGVAGDRPRNWQNAAHSIAIPFSSSRVHYLCWQESVGTNTLVEVGFLRRQWYGATSGRRYSLGSVWDAKFCCTERCEIKNIITHSQEKSIVVFMISFLHRVAVTFI